MSTPCQRNRRHRLALLITLAVIVVCGSGCQTFTLSKDDWEKQQRGEMVDQDVGNAVGVAGSLGYTGAMIGMIAAEVAK